MKAVIFGVLDDLILSSKALYQHFSRLTLDRSNRVWSAIAMKRSFFLEWVELFFMLSERRCLAFSKQRWLQKTRATMLAL